MFARISNGSYVVWMLVAFGFLGSIVFAFPFVLGMLVTALVGGSCAGAGGACGALAVVLGVYLKPSLILIGAALVAIVTFRRGRGTISGGWAGFAATTVWGAAAFLFSAGNFWGANFAVGMLHPVIPWSLLSLAVLTVLFSLDVEDAAGFKGSIAALTGPVGLPSGLLYVATAIWLSATSLSGLLMLPAGRMGEALLLKLMFSLHATGFAWLFSIASASIANSIVGVLLILGILMPGSGAPVETAKPSPPSSGTSSSRGSLQTTKSEPITFGRRGH